LNTIRKLRKDKGISQLKLAELLGVNQTAVSQWERGVTTPSSRMLLQLSTIFNVAPNQILGLVEDQDSPAVWEDLEIMQAVDDNITALLSKIEKAISVAPNAERKIVFDILVNLRHVLYLPDQASKEIALALVQETSFSAVRLADACTQSELHNKQR